MPTMTTFTSGEGMPVPPTPPPPEQPAQQPVQQPVRKAATKKSAGSTKDGE